MLALAPPADDHSAMVSSFFVICICGGFAIALATIGILMKLF
jgi:hypothetical protein